MSLGTLVVATRNPGKLSEVRQIARRILAESGLPADLTLRVVPLAEFPSVPEVAEGTEDFRSNAFGKAIAAAEVTGLPALADDSGLEVDALCGRPGPISSRYAGPAATDDDNNARLLRELAALSAGDPGRRARFRCVAALVWPGGACAEAEGVCEGRIGMAPRGKGGFGYDPLFEVEGFGGATMAELDEDTKNRVSHRARALEGLRDHLIALASTPGRRVPRQGSRA